MILLRKNGPRILCGPFFYVIQKKIVYFVLNKNKIKLMEYICTDNNAKPLTAMTTASAIFTAAHLAAKVADKVVAYKVRFSTALRAAWAATKQTVKAIMEIITTPAAVATEPANVFEIHHTAGTAVFTMRRPLREVGAARLMVASTLRSLAGGNFLFERNGQKYYHCTDITSLSNVDARDAADFGITADDVAAAAASINA